MYLNLEDLRAPDVVDSANVAVELETMSNIALARSKAREEFDTQKLQAKGECHYCGNRVDDDQLFCDDECRADFIEEQEKRSRLEKMRANVNVSR
jgi:predicted nucleic acid-binding Zn ribbon protein